MRVKPYESQSALESGGYIARLITPDHCLTGFHMGSPVT
jgi:hypothetical protein